MLADSLIGKSVDTALDSKTRRASIVAAVEIGSAKELQDKLDKLKRALGRTNGDSVLLLAIKV